MSLSLVQEISISVHKDNRGHFRELISERLQLPFPISDFVQSNLSRSARGVFRGLHMQLPPFGQGKFVQCVQGAIRDFILDPRPESPDFGKFIEIELDEDGDKAIWVPSELAHGFLATQDETIVVYSVTENWSRQHERTIQPKSTALSDVLDFDALVLSHKDRAAPSLATVAAELAALTQA